MQAAREQSHIRLKLNSLEAQILEHVLRAVTRNYKTAPSELDPKTAAVWYSTHGCATARMSAEETKDWVDTLHGLKSGQLNRLEESIKVLAAQKTPPIHLQFSIKDATSLMTVLNDHRLFVAARNDIGQREMDLHSVRALQELTPAQQGAVCEIHFLACVIEELMRVIAPEASGWMTDEEEEEQDRE